MKFGAFDFPLGYRMFCELCGIFRFCTWHEDAGMICADCQEKLDD